MVNDESEYDLFYRDEIILCCYDSNDLYNEFRIIEKHNFRPLGKIMPQIIVIFISKKKGILRSIFIPDAFSVRITC